MSPDRRVAHRPRRRVPWWLEGVIATGTGVLVGWWLVTDPNPAPLAVIGMVTLAVAGLTFAVALDERRARRDEQDRAARRRAELIARHRRQ